MKFTYQGLIIPGIQLANQRTFPNFTSMNYTFQHIIIGAGFSGICAAIKLKEAGMNNFVILERNPHIGGTWWDNNYPGAVCDVESHLYSFSFETNPNWSRVFSP